jgi:anaerobic selenocysteine-containing dehydrogenase
VPFVVVSELFLTETAAAATLVLPARAAFEKGGHSYDLSGALRELAPAFDGPPGPLADGEMLIALGDALGHEVPVPRMLRERAVAAVPQPASGYGDPALCGPPNEAAPQVSGGLRLAIAADPFAGAGTLAHDARLHELWLRPGVTLNAQTAEAAGIASGDVVDLNAGERTVQNLPVRIGEDCVDGVVRIVDGLADAPASGFVDGESVTLAVRAGAAVGTP